MELPVGPPEQQIFKSALGNFLELLVGSHISKQYDNQVQVLILDWLLNETEGEGRERWRGEGQREGKRERERRWRKGWRERERGQTTKDILVATVEM